MSEFTHLHVHTQYSILDGAAKIEALFTKAKKDGMNSLAITDHGNMYGVIDFFKKAQAMDVKPIIGCEVYVAANGMTEKSKKEDRSGFHLILLAKNKTGYENLIKIVTMGFKVGFYYTPRVDKDLLRKYSEGIIALSACLGGEIPKSIINSGIEKAEEVLLEYMDIFGEDFYLEIQRHGLSDQEIVNEKIVELSKKHNVKLIASNDVHYVNKEDFEAHSILICLNTGKNIDEQDLMYSGQEYLKSQKEMAELFSDIPEAITNTEEIVDKIEYFDLKRDIIMPVFPLSEGFDDEDVYLSHLTSEGAKERYPDMNEETKSRITHELSIIKKMRLAGYFLIVQDFINYAKNNDVIVGPGRGSAAGSVVAYCTGITNIDPIKYNLLFERFLNTERVSMPDVDVDFDDDGREKVIDYVVEKYGENRVAQIITFGSMAARLAIRDVARVLRLPLSEADKLAKLVPEVPGISLKKAFKDVKELGDARKKGSELVQKTLRFAETLEGSARHTGTHACGVIIGPDDLMNYIPLSTAKDSKLMVTQYDGKFVEFAGMLKMDFLGLKTLSIIKDAIENIYQKHNIEIDIDNIPLDDKETYELFQRGHTIGVFQFESDGMRKNLKELKPTDIEDLIAMNALYRPGPMAYIPVYINRKLGREKIKYPHPMLEEILKPTYGIMVYQEQIMQAAQIMGGFTLEKADLLRRAMGKKKMEIMQEQREQFIKGAQEKGVDEKKASDVFETMMEFAKYGFNRSHSAAYSMIAYQTAYLKAHYSAEYMAAILTHNLNDIKKITFFIEATKRSNIAVLGPDINESRSKFFVNKKGQIRFGLGAIKGVGEIAAKSIIEEREENGFYKNIFDLTKRANLRSVNKRCLEALAMAGAFDSFENTHRAQYFFYEENDDTNFIEKIIKHSSNYQQKQNSTQQSLFGDDSEIEIANPSMPVCEPWSKLEQLSNEKEVIGFYVSGHPLDAYKIEIENFTNCKINMLNGDLKKIYNKEFKFAGIVTSVNHKTTKKGNPFGTFIIEDYSDSIHLSLFGENYLDFKKFILEPGRFLHIRAKVQKRYYDENQFEIKINNIILLSEALEKFANKITLQIPLEKIDDSFNNKFLSILKKHKGKCELTLRINDNGDCLELPSNKFRVNCSELIKELSELENIKYKIN